MWRAMFIAFFVLLSVACRHRLGNDHLPQQEMQKILLDINLAEVYSINIKDSVHRSSIKNTDSLSVFYKTIFDHYKITPEQFNNSLEWYKSHPEELDSVYDKMIPVATRWQNKADAAKKAAPPAAPLPKSDSLKPGGLIAN